MTVDRSNSVNRCSLNEHQCRALLSSCQHIDKMLAQIEDILDSANSKSAFPKYIDDLAPTKHKVIQDHIDHLRAQMVHVLATQNIQPEKPKIAASHAIHASLTFIEIAIEDLRPNSMRGYGQLTETAVVDLNNLVKELHGSAQQLHRYVLQDG